MILIEFQIHTYKMAANLGIDLNQAQKERIVKSNQLDEMRQQAEERTILMQKQRKQWHDSHIKMKEFKEGDWAYSLTPNLEIIKPSSQHIGWAHMKQFKYLKMDQSNLLQLMEKATPLLSMDIG